MSTEIINMYERLPSKYKDKKVEYPAYKDIRINIPFRALIIGSSGSGKTNLTLSLIRLIPVFDRIYLFAANLEEKLYTWLREWFNKFEEKVKRRVLFFSNDINDIPPLETFDGSFRSLVIFDDLVDKKNLKDTFVSSYFTGGRKRGLSCAFLSQTYFGVPDIIRKNVNYIFLKKVASMKDLSRICREYTLDISPKAMTLLYRDIVRDLGDFMLIDLDAPDGMKFRANWNVIDTSKLSYLNA